MIVRCRAAAAACLAVLFVAAINTVVTAADAMPDAARIVTGQRSFMIPFELEPPREPSLVAVEVRLILSRDGGATWQPVDRADPKAKRFSFRAPDDGEYWFALQTVDRNGREFPGGEPRAGLIVIVDASKIGAATIPSRPDVHSPAAEGTRAQPWPADGKTDVPLERAIDGAGTPKVAPVHSRIASRVAGSAATERQLVGLAALPPGERPRFFATHAFQLAYDVEGDVTSNLDRLELWQTADAGATWGRAAVSQSADLELSRPFRVAVNQDGLYGYRLVAITRRGGSERSPQSGDSPQMWALVDTAPPDVQITMATIRKPQDPDARQPQLAIQWKITDAALAHRPITLSYSGVPGGPWTTFASGLENNGFYDWPLVGRLPRRLYLRIEARDAAGNVGRHEPVGPVAVPHAGE
jgi:hypothetical protein